MCAAVLDNGIHSGAEDDLVYSERWLMQCARAPLDRSRGFNFRFHSDRSIHSMPAVDLQSLDGDVTCQIPNSPFNFQRAKDIQTNGSQEKDPDYIVSCHKSVQWKYCGSAKFDTRFCFPSHVCSSHR